MEIRLFETFAGYGGAGFALKKEGIPYEVVGWSEIDVGAIVCFQQNHCKPVFSGPLIGDWLPKNSGNIKNIDWSKVPDFDLITGGFPCQDVSTAGKQDLNKGRSVLGLELTKALMEKKPRYFLFENVKGIFVG